jgi:hypothetical protein
VNSRIIPAELNTLSNEQLYGLNVNAAGWGVANDGTNPRYLETVELKILTKTECEERISRGSGSPVILPDKLLCSIAEPFALLINVSENFLV